MQRSDLGENHSSCQHHRDLTHQLLSGSVHNTGPDSQIPSIGNGPQVRDLPCQTGKKSRSTISQCPGAVLHCSKPVSLARHEYSCIYISNPMASKTRLSPPPVPSQSLDSHIQLSAGPLFMRPDLSSRCCHLLYDTGPVTDHRYLLRYRALYGNAFIITILIIPHFIPNSMPQIEFPSLYSGQRLRNPSPPFPYSTLKPSLSPASLPSKMQLESDHN